MPAGPSEVLVIADQTADPAFVASDLLSQAEHGVDSQVVLIAVGLDEAQLKAIEDELHNQAYALPRVDIVRGAIEHSMSISVPDLETALKWSNYYAPEHLILQIEDPHGALPLITNAGSCFMGQWTPESVGDYSAGVNHSLPTYGYARQYSGVNLASFMKHITSSAVSQEGVKHIGAAVVELARVEGLDAHKRAMELRMEALGLIEPRCKKTEPEETAVTQGSSNFSSTPGQTQGFENAADEIDKALPASNTNRTEPSATTLGNISSSQAEKSVVEDNKLSLEASKADGSPQKVSLSNGNSEHISTSSQ